MLLGYDGCYIGLYTLGGELVLLINVGARWGILDASFTFYSVLKYLLVSRLGGSDSVQLLVVVSL